MNPFHLSITELYKIPGYRSFHKSRENSTGGCKYVKDTLNVNVRDNLSVFIVNVRDTLSVLIVNVRDNLSVFTVNVRDNLSVFMEEEIQSTFVELVSKRNKTTILGGIYRIPNTNEKRSLQRYETIVEKILLNNKK